MVRHPAGHEGHPGRGRRLAHRPVRHLRDLFGITWWDSHDLNPKLSGYVDLEYDLGLFTNDRKLKPIGKTIRKLIAKFDRHPPRPPRRTTALVLPDDMIPVKDFSALFNPFMKLIDEGTDPAIVLQSRTTDPAYLAARGIKTLLPPANRPQAPQGVPMPPPAAPSS